MLSPSPLALTLKRPPEVSGGSRLLRRRCFPGGTSSEPRGEDGGLCGAVKLSMLRTPDSLQLDAPGKTLTFLPLGKRQFPPCVPPAAATPALVARLLLPSERHALTSPRRPQAPPAGSGCTLQSRTFTHGLRTFSMSWNSLGPPGFIAQASGVCGTKCISSPCPS